MSYLPGMMMAWDRPGSRGRRRRRRPAGRCQVRLRSHPGAIVAKFEVPDGWAVQAFTFALDCTPEQAACMRRQFGGRRYARNWAVRTLKDDVTQYRETGRDRDRVTFTTGAIRVEPDRRHVTLPRIGTVRTCENTRRLERLTAKGRASILAVTVSRKGTRQVAAFRVLVQRPQQAGVADPDSRVGVDVG